MAIMGSDHPCLPEIAKFSTQYFILSKVYTDGGGINSYTMVYQPVREKNHSLKLMYYLLVQADTP